MATLCATLAGCGAATVRIGNDFDAQSVVRQIKAGVTTKAQIRQWLGEPQGAGDALEISGESYEQWTYFYGSGRIPNMSKPTVKTFQIKFDQAGVVRAFNWSDSEHSRP
ncbi:MAG: outer membrane protein assembly factor BamE [Nitrosomonadales bacterium]|nr:outer membrane protein assembly factor BamE [Nitrosomonadales bacterium]